MAPTSGTAMPELLTLALDGHGGIQRWRRAESITASFTADGALFASKGHPGGLGTAQATAAVTTPHLTFTPFAGSTRGVFTPDHVTLTAEDGTRRQRDNPMAALSALAPAAPWDDLHFLYFTGYAMWNYLCAPFFLAWPGFVLEEIEPWSEGQETWRRLRVSFPSDVPTHGAEQVFHFDDAGLLRRLDYTPEIPGAVPAVHYCEGHKDFSGLVVPTQRRVYGRREDGTAQLEPTFVTIDIHTVAVS